MLRPHHRPDQVRKWVDRLADRVHQARKGLAGLAPSRLVARAGCIEDLDGALRLNFLWRDYLIRPPDMTIERADTGATPSSFTQALILAYLSTADGATPSRRWISFRDLPGGMFYAQAFRGYAEVRLIRELAEGGQEAFRHAAERLGGDRIGIGGDGYAFRVLPRLCLAAVYWPGDEDLIDQASILFEDTAPHYLVTDGLAILGSHLVNEIVRAARS